MKSQVSLSLLKRPVFLSTLPGEDFKELERKYLFSEIARLDRLIESYPELIAAQSDIATINSLQYCFDKALARYNELRKLV